MLLHVFLFHLQEHKHWVLQCLGTRFVNQLLDADPARYQVCLRDLTRKSAAPQTPGGSFTLHPLVSNEEILSD